MASILAAPILQPQIDELLATVNKDLIHLWKGMPLELQARLVQLGFKTADAFAMLDDDVAGVRKFVKDEVLLKSEGNPEYRAQTAMVLAAWEAAREQIFAKAYLCHGPHALRHAHRGTAMGILLTDSPFKSSRPTACERLYVAAGAARSQAG